MFPEAKTWDDAARMQKTEFSKLRGEDVYPVTAGQAGAHVTHIPRTTISDVRQVADYWALAIARAGVDKSDQSKIKLWNDALAQVMRIPSDVDPNSTSGERAHERGKYAWPHDPSAERTGVYERARAGRVPSSQPKDRLRVRREERDPMSAARVLSRRDRRLARAHSAGHDACAPMNPSGEGVGQRGLHRSLSSRCEHACELAS